MAGLAAPPLVPGGLAALLAGGAFQQLEVVETHHHRQLVGEHHFGLVVVVQKQVGVERQDHFHAANHVVPGLLAVGLDAVALVLTAQGKDVVPAQVHRLAGLVGLYQERGQGFPLVGGQAPQGLRLLAQVGQLLGAATPAGGIDDPGIDRGADDDDQKQQLQDDQETHDSPPLTKPRMLAHRRSGGRGEGRSW